MGNKLHQRSRIKLIRGLMPSTPISKHQRLPRGRPVCRTVQMKASMEPPLEWLITAAIIDWRDRRIRQCQSSEELHTRSWFLLSHPRQRSSMITKRTIARVPKWSKLSNLTRACRSRTLRKPCSNSTPSKTVRCSCHPRRIRH